ASFVVAFFVVRAAAAETLQGPAGGKSFLLGGDRIACAPPAGGWTLEREGRAVKPPAADDAIGKAVELRVAPLATGCASGGAAVTLVTTARFPAIDAASLVVHVDEARAEPR